MSESEARLEAIKIARELGADTIEKIVQDANALAAFIVRGDLATAPAQFLQQRRVGTRSKA